MSEKKVIPKPPRGSSWKGEMRALAELTTDPRNPRVIRDAKFRDLVRSIKNAPWMLYEKPIKYVDGGVVLCGNQRRVACVAAGFTHCPAEDVSYLDEEQREELRIKDNTHAGEWDTEMLANVFDHATLEDWGLNLGVMAFGADAALSGPQRESRSPDLGGEPRDTNANASGDAKEPTAHSDPKTGELQFPLGIVVNKVESLQWSQIKDQLGSKRDSEAFKELLKVLRAHDVTLLKKKETAQA
jgi:hypothetical protein